MGLIEDIFGIDDTKRIYRKDFDIALRQIPDISKEERDYLNQVFANDLKDGLTAFELKHRIEHLQHNPDDILDPWEVEQVRRKLTGELGKK
ncbi:MAG: hypothetical protein ACOZAL_00405 [Patescibacteria group bacterium]